MTQTDEKQKQEWIQRILKERETAPLQTTHKCSSCGGYLTESESKNMEPGFTRRCDLCVISETFMTGDEEDYDDSEDPPTEFKLNSLPKPTSELN